jgi:outer membrane protein OmpA-like peptidoglycan-associated protein
MCQPRKWWWGLLPLALLWVFAVSQKAGPIADDLKARAEATGAAIAGITPGLAPLAAMVAGRDVSVAGDVRAADLQSVTLRAVDDQSGIRRVEGALKVAQPLRPYTWSAIRDGAKITLTGFVPDDATKAANAAAAARAFAGAQVDDQQRIAFGAPAGFAAASALGLAEIGRLSAGKASLSDSGFCFEGAAATSDSFLEVVPRIATAPQGFTRQACAVVPPTVAPYVWSAAKAAGGAITLTGLYPSDAVRAEINAAVRAAAPGAAVTDNMKPALGAPAALMGMISAGMGQLARMVEGTVSIAGNIYNVAGRGPAGFEACNALRSSLSGQLAQGFSLGNAAIECPPPPPPPPPPVVVAPPPPAAVPVAVAPPPAPAVLSWSAVKNPSGIVLSGMAPTAAAKAAAASSASIATTGAVIDNMTVPANVATPPEYTAATNFALGQLALLATGQVSLNGPALVVTGNAPSAAVKSAVDAALAGALPGGMRLARSEIAAPVPPPPPPPPPAVVIAPPPPPPQPVNLVWAAAKSSSGITLSGLAPSAEARLAVAAAARAATTGAVIDNMTVQGNLATPPAYAAATDFALSQLGRLSAGQVSLAGPAMTLTGAAATPDARRMVEMALAGTLPGGARLAQASVAVRPYAMEAQADKSGLVLRGYVPDQASKTELVSSAEAAGFSGKIRDELQIVSGAPANFAAAARTALGNLLRLDLGTARVDDQSITLQGMTCRDVIRQEVETGARAGLPAGFAGSGQVSIRQTGCTNCQLELDNATTGRNILFQQSKSDLAADADTSAVIDEVARVLQACPTARIAVEGHANFDGERRGYPNKPLSEARARAVIAALVTRGLAENRFTPVGFGPEKPLIPHGTVIAREQNRRVQFTIVNP